MGKIVFVEILDKRGNVRERVRIDSFPATVGRGYANAVIVDDRLVNAEHLRLSLDIEGGILVEDLNTASGTRLLKSEARVEQYRIPAGREAVLRIGQTVLRLRGDDFAVGPVAPSRTSAGAFGRSTQSSVIAFLIFVAGFSLYVFVFAQEITKKVIWSDLAGRALVLLIIFALWTGFWSFLSRLVVHSFRFMTHLGISGIASMLFLGFFTAEEYFEFLSSAPGVAAITSYAGFVVIFSFLLYGHLSVMSELSLRKRIFSSVLISAGIVSIVLLISYAERREFSNELRFSSVIKPIGHKWVRTVSPERFFSDLGTLKARIDAMAQDGPTGKVDKK